MIKRHVITWLVEFLTLSRHSEKVLRHRVSGSSDTTFDFSHYHLTKVLCDLVVGVLGVQDATLVTFVIIDIVTILTTFDVIGIAEVVIQRFSFVT